MVIVVLMKIVEFCNHQHEFTVNGNTLGLLEYPNEGVRYGCYERVNQGVSANQYGTWVYGRAGCVLDKM